MITGDHAVTAQAIGETLGPRARARSAAPSCRRCPTRSSSRRLPELHVFGRVSPQDKLRLARLMQEQGLIVAMTGDAVNDAAALKQADIGVAMGSGSEVTKQAGRMILTDDNFGTLVHAVEIGRRVYEKVVSYVRYQMTQLLALVLLFIAATAFDINEGVALTPLMVLYLLVFVTASGVVVIARRPRRARRHAPAAARPEGADHQPRARSRSGCVYAATLFVAALVPLVARARRPEHRRADRVADDDVRRDGPRHRLQRAHEPARPGERALAAAAQGARRSRSFPLALIVLATELPGLQKGLLTTSLTGTQWLACFGLAALLPLVVETSKWLRRRRAPAPGPRRRATRARRRPSASRRRTNDEQARQRARHARSRRRSRDGRRSRRR